MAARGAAVPLTRYQAEVARLLATNRSPDNYLAGGAALHIEPNSKRYSNDLDYFQDSEERVARAFADDLRLLAKSGYEIEVLLQQPGFVRALVRREGDETKIEWAHDSAWRFMPVMESETAGYVLHPVDLATNKLLALVGRDEPSSRGEPPSARPRTLSRAEIRTRSVAFTTRPPKTALSNLHRTAMSSCTSADPGE
jgi:hypothetical protein